MCGITRRAKVSGVRWILFHCPARLWSHVIQLAVQLVQRVTCALLRWAARQHWCEEEEEEGSRTGGVRSGEGRAASSPPTSWPAHFTVDILVFAWAQLLLFVCFSRFCTAGLNVTPAIYTPARVKLQSGFSRSNRGSLKAPSVERPHTYRSNNLLVAFCPWPDSRNGDRTAS